METVTAPERLGPVHGGGAVQAHGTQVPVGTARPAPAQATSGVSRPGPSGKPEPGMYPRSDRVTAVAGKQLTNKGEPGVVRAAVL